MVKARIRKGTTMLDIYPHCVGCPREKYCGTMISSYRCCNNVPKQERELYEQGHKNR